MGAKLTYGALFVPKRQYVNEPRTVAVVCKWLLRGVRVCDR